MKHPLTCSACNREQEREDTKSNGALCISPLCQKPLCLFCGCTENHPCYVSQSQLLSNKPDYCGWIAPSICSNPNCITAAYFAITQEEINTAQRYYQFNPLQQQQPGPTLNNLHTGDLKDENELAHVIINYLIREDQGHILNTLGIDVFDIISGEYDQSAYPLVGEIFQEWNSRLENEFFSCGTNHSTTLVRQPLLK